MGFSIIFTIHFGVPLFLETPKYCWMVASEIRFFRHQLVVEINPPLIFTRWKGSKSRWWFCLGISGPSTTALWNISKFWCCVQPQVAWAPWHLHTPPQGRLYPLDTKSHTATQRWEVISKKKNATRVTELLYFFFDFEDLKRFCVFWSIEWFAICSGWFWMWEPRWTFRLRCILFAQFINP